MYQTSQTCHIRLLSLSLLLVHFTFSHNVGSTLVCVATRAALCAFFLLYPTISTRVISIFFLAGPGPLHENAVSPFSQQRRVSNAVSTMHVRNRMTIGKRDEGGMEIMAWHSTTLTFQLGVLGGTSRGRDSSTAEDNTPESRTPGTPRPRSTVRGLSSMNHSITTQALIA